MLAIWDILYNVLFDLPFRSYLNMYILNSFLKIVMPPSSFQIFENACHRLFEYTSSHDRWHSSPLSATVNMANNETREEIHSACHFWLVIFSSQSKFSVPSVALSEIKKNRSFFFKLNGVTMLHPPRSFMGSPFIMEMQTADKGNLVSLF